MRAVRLAEVLVGALFVFSALLKALDLQSFAVQVSYYGIVRQPTWVWATVAGVVAVETILGALMLSGIRLRGVTWSASALLLAGFTSLLLYAWFYKGLEDCGCFGKYLKMSPRLSVGKNLAVLAVMAVPLLWRRTAIREVCRGTAEGNRRWTLGLLGVPVAGILVVSLAAHAGATAGPSDSGRHGIESAKEERPFAKFRIESEGKTYNLSEGEFLIAMLSTTCEHCRKSVEQLNTFALIPEFPPVAALMLGDEQSLEDFRSSTHPEFPVKLIEPLPFFSLIGEAPPRLAHVKDGKLVRFWDETFPKIEELLDLGLAKKGVS